MKNDFKNDPGDIFSQSLLRPFQDVRLARG